MCFCSFSFPSDLEGTVSAEWFKVLMIPSLCSSGWWESSSKYWSVCVAVAYSGHIYTHFLFTLTHSYICTYIHAVCVCVCVFLCVYLCIMHILLCSSVFYICYNYCSCIVKSWLLFVTTAVPRMLTGPGLSVLLVETVAGSDVFLFLKKKKLFIFLLPFKAILLITLGEM